MMKKVPKPQDPLERQRKLAFRDIQAKLRAAYGRLPDDEMADGAKRPSTKFPYQLGTIMQPIDKNWADFSSLKGKRVLDIGCGAKAENAPYHGFGYNGTLGNEFQNRAYAIKYEPWLCRALHILGAEVTGLDINPNYEHFKTVRYNIVTTDLASVFPKESFDIIHTSSLLPPNPSPLLNQAAAKYLQDLRANMPEFVALISKFYDMNSYPARALSDPERKYVDVGDYSGLIEGFVKRLDNSVKSAVSLLLVEGGLFISRFTSYGIKQNGELVNQKL